MVTMDGMVPRPPVMDDDAVRHPFGGPRERNGPIDWRAFMVSVMLGFLVAVPVIVGWWAGVIVRGAALMWAAGAEAYAAGRGPRE
jgi:hypothetical protein